MNFNVIVKSKFNIGDIVKWQESYWQELEGRYLKIISVEYRPEDKDDTLFTVGNLDYFKESKIIYKAVGFYRETHYGEYPYKYYGPNNDYLPEMEEDDIELEDDKPFPYWIGETFENCRIYANIKDLWHRGVAIDFDVISQRYDDKTDCEYYTAKITSIKQITIGNVIADSIHQFKLLYKNKEVQVGTEFEFAYPNIQHIDKMFRVVKLETKRADEDG